MTAPETTVRADLHHLIDVAPDTALLRAVHTLLVAQWRNAERNIRYCLVNEHLAPVYRPPSDAVELLTLFDTRQSPGKLRLQALL